MAARCRPRQQAHNSSRRERASSGETHNSSRRERAASGSARQRAKKAMCINMAATRERAMLIISVCVCAKFAKLLRKRRAPSRRLRRGKSWSRCFLLLFVRLRHYCGASAPRK
jgi:hypothetical protein